MEITTNIIPLPLLNHCCVCHFLYTCITKGTLSVAQLVKKFLRSLTLIVYFMHGWLNNGVYLYFTKNVIKVLDQFETHMPELIQCTCADQHRNKRAWADWTIVLNRWQHVHYVTTCSLQSSCLDAYTQQVQYNDDYLASLVYSFLKQTFR